MMIEEQKNLISDYKKCESIIKKASKSFYQAFKRLEDINQRRAVYAIYAYCRYSDDITDEGKSIKLINDLKEELDLFVKNNTANNYIFRTLKDVRDKFYPKSFDFKPYYDMLDGHLMDLSKTTYNTLDELIVYCTKVASSVGEMLVYVLAPNGDEKILKEISYELGVAMQITNILRDIGEDFLNDRLYLPKDLMEKHGLTVEMIKNKEVNSHFINLFEELAKIAYDYYESAYQKLGVFPNNARKILSYALFIYREIIVACKQNNYDVYSKKNRVDDLRKIQIIKEVDNNES